MVQWNDVAVIVKCVDGRRHEQLNQLKGILESQCVPFVLCEGKDGESPRDNFRRLLRVSMEMDKPVTLHVEDDAYPSPDFSEKAIECLSESGLHDIWTFYSARKEDVVAYKQGRTSRRITPSQYFNSQAVSWPTKHCAAMLEYLPAWEVERKRGISDVDVFIGSYARLAGIKIIASVPSIVQHREIVSMLGHRPRYGRISRTFLMHYGLTPDIDEKHLREINASD